MQPTLRLSCRIAAAFALTALPLAADPLSKHADVDFFRDVASRDLHGLATRSDGRLIAGPVTTDLSGKAPAPLLWSIDRLTDTSWVVGAGPGGKLLEVTPDLAKATVDSREIASLGAVQVFAVRTLPDGSILAGTAPGGGIMLVRAGKVAATLHLPAEAVYDLLPAADGRTVLAATGNPARIYRIDMAAFAASKPGTPDSQGATLFGEVSDKAVRRLARASDGTVIAGTSPKGCLYRFPAGSGTPYLIQENRDAEVTDLLPDDQGGFLATLVFNGGEIHPVAAPVPQEAVVLDAANPAAQAQGQAPNPTPTPHPRPAADVLGVGLQADTFQGRSTLVAFTTEGFPDTLASRQGIAFYRMVRQGGLIVIAGGEKGELVGYDPQTRTSLTFAGSTSSQLNDLVAIPGHPGRFLALRNNAPGLALIAFDADGPRTAVTKRVDLGAPARVGALRIERLRDLDRTHLSLWERTSNATGEAEGWSGWTALSERDGWRGELPVGRYAELKLEVPAGAPSSLQVDRASLYYLTQNHRPQLTEFRVLSPNFAVSVAPEPASPVTTTVGQLLQSGDGEHRKSNFQSSQVYASPGTRVVFWTVTDPDGDNLLYTFSIRHEGDASWTDLAVDSRESYVQFDTAHLKEGTWFTRLVARETAPRPEAERLSVTFETDDLVVDHTPPDILDARVTRANGRVRVTVRGRDALSLLDGAEFNFNNGLHEEVEQPDDGILDGREESFSIEVPADRVSGATSVEVTVYDDAGNAATRRLTL